MNYAYQQKYIDSLFPEIEKAVGETNTGSHFINTAHISEYIFSHAAEFPILSGKKRKHVNEAITCYLQHHLHCKPYSNRTRRNGGRIYIVAGPE